ncbi:hypothetical protein LTS10_007273 [Elasticomyces elasticus]|nr:hypothetical protein LTS10_007273 [Elasticomyces elasticus]
MATDEKPCRLLKLSAELRNSIYELVLLSDDFIDIRTELQPALAKTCRQIREECIQIYYGRSRFEFVTANAQDDALDGITHWLERIGSNHCRTLRTIKIKTGVPNGLMLNDSTNPETPWKVMVERLEKLGVTEAINISVELCAEPLKAQFAHIMSQDSGFPNLRDGIQKSKGIYLSNSVEHLALKYLGQRRCGGHDCKGHSHGDVVTSSHLGRLLWWAARADSILYEGRLEPPITWES